MNNNNVLIIAEAGVNHNGDLNLALELVEAAANAGADCVKFQTFKTASLTTNQADLASYQKTKIKGIGSQSELLKSLELSDEMHFLIKSHCKKCNIGFLSTAFDDESLTFLNSLNVPFFKVPSGEITNKPFLKKIGSYQKPIILSSGASTLEEVRDALKIFELSGLPSSFITVLHCNSEYPSPYSDVNLNAMISLRDKLGISVGYSDHTLGIEVPIAAVALGAVVIEKHLTIDTRLVGPDHNASIEPDSFKLMVQAIRNIEKSMGDGIKQPSKSEIKNQMLIRKSIVAKKDICKGSVFSSENITTKRPGDGLSPMKWDLVIGSVANRSYKINEKIDSP